MPCGSCKNRSFGGTYHLSHQGDKNRRARNNVSSNYQLVVTAKFVPGSLLLFTLMKQAIYSFEKSVFTTATRRHILEEGILFRKGVAIIKLTPLIPIYKSHCNVNVTCRAADNNRVLKRSLYNNRF
jgi:hypothetical protein